MDRRSFLKSLLSLPVVALFRPDKSVIAVGRDVSLLDSVIAGFQYYQGERV